MTENNDEIQNLRDAFIVDTSYKKEKMTEQLKKLIKFANIDKTGNVLIKARGLTGRQRVLVVLVARFIAHELGENVQAEINTKEAADNASMEESVAAARLNGLVNEGFVVRLSRGTFQIRPAKIDEVLKNLDINWSKAWTIV